MAADVRDRLGHRGKIENNSSESRNMAVSRRKSLKMLGALPLLLNGMASAQAEQAVDVEALKRGYTQRLKTLLAAGELPYIDIESSCNSNQADIASIVKTMDGLHIGLIALSADLGKGMFEKKIFYDPLAAKLIRDYPDRFIPVGNGAQEPAFSDTETSAFLDAQESAALERQFFMLGEYEFRHYPSSRQAKRGRLDRDGTVPIDGLLGHQLFSFSEKTGIPFQIHYEIEDALLPPLESMLARYPKAKVIWCHVAQIRYLELAANYSPVYIEGLIQRFPNLYFDTAFGGANSVYPLSGQHHSRIWGSDGDLVPAWRDLIVAYPKRFLSALDLGGDRWYRFVEYDNRHRHFLSRLPLETRHQVAYRSAWSLLFGEEFS